MGNPISPTVADLVMETLLENVIKEIRCEIPVVKKYVDDLFLVIPADKVEEILDTFNRYNSNLQFTCEKEQNRRLPFLDMVVIRQPDQSIKTEWYCKPMASGRFIDYLSTHPLHMKTNMVNNFIRRVREFSTNLTKEATNEIIKQQLKINHYPTTFIHRCLNSTASRAVVVPAQSPEPIIYKPLIYVEKLTSRLKKTFRTDFPNISLATRNEFTIKKLFTNTKDNIPTEMKTNVIYRIPCRDCQASYVGLTSNQLKKRISNHRSNIKQMEALIDATSRSNPTITHELSNLREKTALLAHCIDTRHRFALDDTRVVDQHRRQTALPILEVCHITNTDHTVNKRSDVDCLSSTYAAILHTIKTTKSKQASHSTRTHRTTSSNNSIQ
ncbi:uncharacterized protein LOC128740298 [Sabethes cyaneus]|uniref:uncharacterized protein LOC128740298 n=1 Tax=Sabethes cyaneus TaxID=53552 RepID=UPI00237E9E18|nr:uncharacterized protein LOC128740298 [Sabethes cyaneus]